MKGMPKGKCDGMGDLDKAMQKMHDEGGMIKDVKMPEMPKSMPMPMSGGGTGSKGGGGGAGTGGHGGHK